LGVEDDEIWILRWSRSNAKRLSTPRDGDVIGWLSELCWVSKTIGEDDDGIGFGNTGTFAGDVDKDCLKDADFNNPCHRKNL
jgi:hypothetical protein